MTHTLTETRTSRKTSTLLRTRHTHIEGEKHTQRERDTNSHTKRDTQTLRERPTYTPGREKTAFSDPALNPAMTLFCSFSQPSAEKVVSVPPKSVFSPSVHIPTHCRMVQLPPGYHLASTTCKALNQTRDKMMCKKHCLCLQMSIFKIVLT